MLEKYKLLSLIFFLISVIMSSLYGYNIYLFKKYKESYITPIVDFKKELEEKSKENKRLEFMLSSLKTLIKKCKD